MNRKKITIPIAFLAIFLLSACMAAFLNYRNFEQKRDAYIVLLYLLTNTLRRLRAEKVALQQEQNMFASGSVVVFKWQNRENWPVEYVSASTGDFLGYAASDFLSGKVRYADIVHPEDIPRWPKKLKSTAKIRYNDLSISPTGFSVQTMR